jgi:hypothetical protein
MKKIKVQASKKITGSGLKRYGGGSLRKTCATLPMTLAEWMY